MPTSLTGTAIRDTFPQLLHMDGGPTATEKIVYSGTGVATALRLGTNSATISNLTFTGGTITGITDLAVADGGTGSSTAAGARTNLGLGSLATQNADAVAVTGGTIAGTTVTASTALGYAAGAGGSVSQTTSKSTPVTLNAASGQITMHGESLGSDTGATFQFNNDKIAATDVVVANIVSGATLGAYTLTVTAVAAGSCHITLYHHTAGGALSEAVVLNFVVLKGVHS